VMIGGMVMQPLIGWMLDHRWKGEVAAGVRVYDLAAYQTAFSLIFAWGLLSVALLFFTRETHCRQTT
jgi:hypothetical protein